MLWIYSRGDQSLRLETRFDNETQEFVLISFEQGGSQTERFKNADSFRRRLEGLEKQLEFENWQRDGPPVLLRDGWKI